MSQITSKIMRYFNSITFFLCLPLLILLVTTAFIIGEYGWLRKPSTITSSSPKIEISAKEILSDMKSMGLLKDGFTQWFVAPQGNSAGRGTSESPWDLATALAGGSGKTEIKPGDIVWLLGGKYNGTFTVTVKGREGAAVHFRQFPNERAVIEKTDASRETAALAVRSPHVWFWDFEVTNSFPNREPLDSSGELNPWRGSGINVWAANTKYINLIIYDNGHGFGLWNEDGGTEIYGCLIYNNGNNKKEHGVYAHNKNGTQQFADNLIFNNAGYGLHVYANSVKSSISGFAIEGNTIFNNGALTGEEQVADQVLVGGVAGVSAGRIELRENFIYNFPDAPTSKNRGIRLGYENLSNDDVKILDNYIISRVPLKILWWKSIEARGNTILSTGKRIEIETPANVNLAEYQLDSNTYPISEKNPPVFLLDKRKIDFVEWRQINKFDISGSFSDELIKKGRVFIRLNKYEKRRANVIVFNQSRSSNIPVDLKDFLEKGDQYEVYDAQNYFGQPILKGAFDGKQINLPMISKDLTMPIGNTQKQPIHTNADFGAFIIFKGKNILNKNWNNAE